MDLYRIILVDDEEEVRKSIIRKIDWQAVGFSRTWSSRISGCHTWTG